MTTDITIFTSPQFGEIRTAGTPDKPLFCANDVCRALGYSNTRDAVARHTEDPDVVKRDTGVVTGKKKDGTDSVQTVSVAFVTESGLYSLIFGSKLPQAKEFKRWVTNEVLPSIRKHGAYIAPGTLTELLQRPESIVTLLTTLKTEQEKTAALTRENGEQAAHIAELTNTVNEQAKRVTYLDRIFASASLTMTTSIAQDYGESAARFNKRLHDLGVQHKVGRQWVLYAPYLDKGYVHSETILIDVPGGPKAVTQTKWTQRGRAFLYGVLKDNGLLPTIERGIHQTT